MAKQLEFFFDCSSPWTYLAFSKIEALAAKHKAELLWRPILVGGVFNAVNQDVYEQRAKPNKVKARYWGKDLQDWARAYGLTIKMPPSIFPVRAVSVQRGCIYADQKNCLPAFAKAAFYAYWSEDKDISDMAVLEDICTACGLDAKEFATAIASEEVKTTLRENTEELIARGGFGSPTMFLNKEQMFFGNDRLALLEHALQEQA